MFLLELIFEMLLAAWNGYLEKKGRLYDNHKLRRLVGIIVSIIGIVGFFLIIFILFAFVLLIERVFSIPISQLWSSTTP